MASRYNFHGVNYDVDVMTDTTKPYAFMFTCGKCGHKKLCQSKELGHRYAPLHITNSHRINLRESKSHNYSLRENGETP